MIKILVKIHGVIYKATDPFGKCYIGKHTGDGSDIGITYFGSGKYQTRARKKHGRDYFTYTIIERCYSMEQLNEMEIYYIKFFQARLFGYNQTDGGTGGDCISNFSEEEKLQSSNKKSESQKKRWSDPQERKKMTETSLISQNNLELKKKRAETWDNKSAEEKAEMSRKKSESGKIAKNRPENKKKVTETMSKKSDEEKLIRNKKVSDSNKIAQNRPEVIESKKYHAHIRWDVNRGIINPNCKFCLKGGLS